MLMYEKEESPIPRWRGVTERGSLDLSLDALAALPLAIEQLPDLLDALLALSDLGVDLSQVLVQSLFAGTLRATDARLLGGLRGGSRLLRRLDLLARIGHLVSHGVTRVIPLPVLLSRLGFSSDLGQEVSAADEAPRH